MTNVRIFQKPKNALQSGRFGGDLWFLEFEPTAAQQPDPLTGWAGSGDTRRQVTLKFPTLDAATRYAVEKGLTYRIIPAATRQLKLQAYADNFR